MLQPCPWGDGITVLGLSSCAYISDWEFALFTAGMTESLVGGRWSPFTCFVVNMVNRVLSSAGYPRLFTLILGSTLLKQSHLTKWNPRTIRTYNILWNAPSTTPPKTINPRTKAPTRSTYFPNPHNEWRTPSFILKMFFEYKKKTNRQPFHLRINHRPPKKCGPPNCCEKYI